GRPAGEALVVGLGMNARGAVELVIATVVVNASAELLAAGRIADPLLTRDQFSALVLMAFITTIIAPVSMKWAVMRTCLPDEQESFCRLIEQAPRPR
ncbi:MAG: cation:proton antiporter, partial [Proteobacteria bacterium]|nr:cation:proton antiporter [Pseudomonadota bacterium]